MTMIGARGTSFLSSPQNVVAVGMDLKFGGFVLFEASAALASFGQAFLSLAIFGPTTLTPNKDSNYKLFQRHREKVYKIIQCVNESRVVNVCPVQQRQFSFWCPPPNRPNVRSLVVISCEPYGEYPSDHNER